MVIKIQGNSKFQGKSIFAASSPTPTYTVTSNAVNSADEGTVITFTLNTTNVANGTVLPYTITGITQQDLSSGSLTGNFTVNNNTATASITLANDAITEGAETATLTLDSVDASVAVTVNDTSLTPFSPDQIAGLKGWYDYTYGVYNTNANDATDDQYASVSFSAYNLMNATIYPNPTPLNGKNLYSHFGNYLRWENNLWTLTYQNGVGGDEESGTYPTYATITATGDTQYPWQANWTGTGNNVTRVATINSTTASAGQTVAKWANKVGDLGNIYGGNMIQTVLNSQPIFDGDGISFYSQRLSALFSSNPSAARTYYFVGRSKVNSRSNCVILASSSASTLIRGGLVHKLFSPRQRYGLNQGTSDTTLGYSTFEGNEYRDDIICASFESAGSGKIKRNNLDEQTLTNIGTQFNGSSSSLYMGSTQTFNYLTAKEILFFEGAHTTEQKTQVINYLNAKYNLF